MIVNSSRDASSWRWHAEAIVVRRCRCSCTDGYNWLGDNSCSGGGGLHLVHNGRACGVDVRFLLNHRRRSCR